MPTVLDQVRDHLIAAEIVRDPKVPGTVPPMWRQPRHGCPAPGEGSAPEADPNAVLAVVSAPGIPPRRFEGALRRDGVDIWLRVARAPLAFALEAAIRNVMNDRRGFELGGVRVEECLLFRDLQLVESDDQAFSFTVGYVIERWA